MNYWVSFGQSAVSGLAPTFIQFRTIAGGTLPPPSIAEPGSFGLYYFSYNALTQVAFICDGATTGLSFQNRYVQGVLDPSDNFGTLIGNTNSSFGTNVSDPVSVFGFLKRALEDREGNETYTKASGSLQILSRGSSQLLATKTISDSTTETSKT